MKHKEEEGILKHQLILIRDSLSFDGFEVAKRLYKDKLHLDYLVVIYSSNDVQGNFVKSKRLGVDYYLLKPYNPNEVFTLLKENFINIDDRKIMKVQSLRQDISILVAEDNIINQKVAQTIFNNLGYKIEIARDGEEVLEKTKIQNFDIIFMDLQMPVLDGMETTIELRGSGKDLPIIAMTASASKQIERKALSVGMNGYLVKPVKIETIKEILTEWFSEDISE